MDTVGGSGSESSDRAGDAGRIHVSLSRRSLIVLAMIALAPWLFVGLAEIRQPAFLWSAEVGPATGRASAPRPAGGPASLHSRPGPWGDLEYIPITIAPPAEYMQELSPDMMGNPWHFPGMTVDQVKSFLDQLDLTAEQRSRLAARVATDPKTGGCVITPEADVVQALSPDARKWLYWLLGGSPLNLDQANAFRIPCGDYESRLSGLMLPPSVTNLVRHLSYGDDRYKFFADLPLVLPLVPDPQDRVRLVRTLCEQSTMLIRLRVNEDSNIAALVEYWGRGGRTNEVTPLLESLARVPGGESVSVVGLLTGFPRGRMYTYMRPTMDEAVVAHDCHWTSLNFFNDRPDDRFLDKQIVRKVVATEYHPIFANPALGDLVLLVDRQRTVVHSAVYIADDIVLTKNGSRYSAPWMFARIDDVKAFYRCHEPVTVEYARRNDL